VQQPNQQLYQRLELLGAAQMDWEPLETQDQFEPEPEPEVEELELLAGSNQSKQEHLLVKQGPWLGLMATTRTQCGSKSDTNYYHIQLL
jgi:hypothetical protein